jgi:hypothetical protein
MAIGFEQGSSVYGHPLQRWNRLAVRSGGRLPEFWRDQLRRDPYLRQARMVVELVIGGGVYRIVSGSGPLTSTSTLDGLTYAATIPMDETPEIDSSIAIGKGESSTRAIQFSIPAHLIRPADLVRDGYLLAGIGEVYLQVDGGDHDQRFVIMRGDLLGGVRFGRATERIEFELVDPRETLGSSRMPPFLIDLGEGSRFASRDLPESSIGQAIPVVLNRFERIPAVRIQDYAGDRDFLFAHTHGWEVDYVYVNGSLKLSGDVVYAWDLEELFDDYGEPISVISFSVAATAWADGDTVQVSVRKGPPDEYNVIESIAKILEDYTMIGRDGIVPELFSEAARKVIVAAPRILINGSSEANSANAITWIEGAFLKSFPMISMVWDAGGYGPVVVDRRATPTTDLVAGAHPLLSRLPGESVQESPKEELYSDFVVRYDFDTVSGKFRGAVTRHPGNSAVCAYAKSFVGLRAMEPRECLYFADLEVASFVIDWLVAHYAMPSYLVGYEGTRALLFRVRRGDTIRLTDSDFGWTNEKAVVERVVLVDSGVRVWFRVWPSVFDLLGGSRSY